MSIEFTGTMNNSGQNCLWMTSLIWLRTIGILAQNQL